MSTTSVALTLGGWTPVDCSIAARQRELADAARLKLMCVLEWARANGHYRLAAGKLDGPAAPSPFGVAGIGYRVLRFLRPNQCRRY